MPKFFVKTENVKNENIIISGEDFNHIKNVLRLRRGENITVGDFDGTDYTVSIESYETDCVITRILSTSSNNTESDIDVVLFQGIPKSDKMELIIQKSVELGVKRIVPVFTERTVVKLNGDKDIKNKVSRWQRIALEASKQCNRGIVPQIESPIQFENALRLAGTSDLSVIPYEKENANRLKPILMNAMPKSISVIIGPEGGFTEKEISKSIENKVVPVTLGPRILRTETAGFVALSILMYELGDIG